jgi:hypothetical protein
MSHTVLAQGPAPMMIWSQPISPLSVSTARIAPPAESLLKPVTVQPVRMRTPSFSALVASAYIALVLLA